MHLVIRFIRQFVMTISGFLDSYSFIKEHRLWQGFARHRFAFISLLILGALMSLHLMGVIRHWWQNFQVEDVGDLGVQAGFFISEIATSSYRFMFEGGYKYVVLIVMEMLTIHMVIRTDEIIGGENRVDITVKRYLQAQVRMIKVSVFSFIMELIASTGMKIILGILGLNLLKMPSLFLIQCFFLGFAMLDNYNEISKLKIKESYKYTLKYSGVSVAVGLFLYVIILIPLIGPFIGPMLAAVTTVLVMYDLDKEKSRTAYIAV